MKVQKLLFLGTILSIVKSQNFIATSSECRTDCIDQGQKYCKKDEYTGYCCTFSDTSSQCSTTLNACSKKDNVTTVAKYYYCPRDNQGCGDQIISVSTSKQFIENQDRQFVAKSICSYEFVQGDDSLDPKGKYNISVKLESFTSTFYAFAVYGETVTTAYSSQNLATQRNYSQILGDSIFLVALCDSSNNNCNYKLSYQLIRTDNITSSSTNSSTTNTTNTQNQTSNNSTVILPSSPPKNVTESSTSITIISDQNDIEDKGTSGGTVVVIVVGVIILIILLSCIGFYIMRKLRKNKELKEKVFEPDLAALGDQGPSVISPDQYGHQDYVYNQDPDNMDEILNQINMMENGKVNNPQQVYQQQTNGQQQQQYQNYQQPPPQQYYDPQIENENEEQLEIPMDLLPEWMREMAYNDPEQFQELMDNMDQDQLQELIDQNNSNQIPKQKSDNQSRRQKSRADPQNKRSRQIEIEAEEQRQLQQVMLLSQQEQFPQQNQNHHQNVELLDESANNLQMLVGINDEEEYYQEVDLSDRNQQRNH
ncbi:UNKNOWN [Stylonychia lemnae]|uniref:Transmembrane protein n=1 Tax=Stylonychia lemnae TaxID=5949 RepID=A0A078B6D4_STYLE|nr:UNKNOWN [Stylonychia lemnae]|eukprot:CDW89919.1 UNKNOWN [Stylonychia lemnae]